MYFLVSTLMTQKEAWIYGFCFITLGILQGYASSFITFYLIAIILIIVGLFCALFILYTLAFSERESTFTLTQLLGFTLTGFLLGITISDIRAAKRLSVGNTIISELEMYKVEHDKYPESLKVIHRDQGIYWYNTDSKGTDFHLRYQQVHSWASNEYLSYKGRWFTAD